MQNAFLFPLWWYSRGLAIMSAWVGSSIKTANNYLAVSVWVRNLFVPMYGEKSISGRLISFFVRLFMILVRGIGLVFWIAITIILFIAYLAALPLSIFGIIYHTGGLIIQ